MRFVGSRSKNQSARLNRELLQEARQLSGYCLDHDATPMVVGLSKSYEVVQVPRPTLLIAEPEPLQALSVRKLVLETAKFNVLTAHSTGEALDIFHMFPNVPGVILVGESSIDCEKVALDIKNASHNKPIIYLHGSVGGRCSNSDHDLSSHEPQALLELVRSLFGDPRTTETDSEREPNLTNAKTIPARPVPSVSRRGNAEQMRKQGNQV